MACRKAEVAARIGQSFLLFRLAVSLNPGYYPQASESGTQGSRASSRKLPYASPSSSSKLHSILIPCSPIKKRWKQNSNSISLLGAHPQTVTARPESKKKRENHPTGNFWQPVTNLYLHSWNNASRTISLLPGNLHSSRWLN